MAIKVAFAELHNPLFLGGKNFGMKLDPGRLSTLSLEYDQVEKELLVTWLDKTAHVPAPNVSYYIPGEPKGPAVQVHHPAVAGAITSAQVETPHGHVHQGPGKGKTGK